MTPGSVIAPMTWLEPPHLGHRLKSMANTRCNRAIQPSGGLRTLGWGSGSSVPEPGAVGLGLLAMGAGGIRRLRQRREAQPAH